VEGQMTKITLKNLNERCDYEVRAIVYEKEGNYTLEMVKIGTFKTLECDNRKSILKVILKI